MKGLVRISKTRFKKLVKEMVEADLKRLEKKTLPNL